MTSLKAMLARAKRGNSKRFICLLRGHQMVLKLFRFTDPLGRKRRVMGRMCARCNRVENANLTVKLGGKTQ